MVPFANRIPYEDIVVQIPHYGVTDSPETFENKSKI